MRTFLCALVAVVAAVLPAHANADGELLAKLGFLGQWAYDCSQTASGDNPRLSVEAPADGLPVERLLTNGAYDRVHSIADVRQLPDGKVRWTQITNDGTLTLLKVIEKDRTRTWSSVGADGEVFIKDGRFTSGDEVRWFYRCAQ
jgi:hypothetical protein